MSTLELPARPRVVLDEHASDAAWLAAREDGLGGSDVAAALGVSDYQTPLELYLRKSRLVPPEQVNEAMAWGTRLEPIVLAWIAEQHGGRLVRAPRLLARADAAWALASLDGLLCYPDHAPSIAEAKTTGDGAHWDDEDVLPAAHELQARWYQYVTGCEIAVVGALIRGNRGVLRIVERRASLEQRIVDAATLFWERVCVGEPPPAGGTRDERRTLNQLGADDEIVCDLHEGWHDRLAQRALWAGRLDEAEHALGVLDNQLRADIGPATVAYLDGRKVATWKPATRREIDGERLRAEQPDVADAYTKRTTYRSLRFAKGAA